MFLSLSVFVCLVVLLVECVVQLKSHVIMLLEYSDKFGFTYGLRIKYFLGIAFAITIFGLLTPANFYTKSGKPNILTYAYTFLAFSICFFYLIYLFLHFFLWSKVKIVIRQLDLNKLFKQKFTDKKLSRLFDNVQIYNKCCGIEGPEEWFTTKWWNDTVLSHYHYKVPISCCNKNNCVYASKVLKDLTIHYDGCDRAFEKSLAHFFLVNWLMALFIFLIQLIVFLVLLSKLKKDKRYKGFELKFLVLRLFKNGNKGDTNSKQTYSSLEFRSKKQTPSNEEIKKHKKSQTYLKNDSSFTGKTNSNVRFENENFANITSESPTSSPRKFRCLMTGKYLNDFPMNYKLGQCNEDSLVTDNYSNASDETNNSTVKAVVSFGHSQTEINEDNETNSYIHLDYNYEFQNPEINEYSPPKNEAYLEWLKKERNKLSNLNFEIKSTVAPIESAVMNKFRGSPHLNSKEKNVIIKKLDEVIRALNNPSVEKTRSMLQMITDLELNKHKMHGDNASQYISVKDSIQLEYKDN